MSLSFITSCRKHLCLSLRLDSNMSVLLIRCRVVIFGIVIGSDWPQMGQILNFLKISFNKFRLGVQIWSDWPKMGQIWDFLRPVSVHFGLPTQNVLKLIFKSPRCVPFGSQSDPIWMPNITSLNRCRSCTPSFFLSPCSNRVFCFLLDVLMTYFMLSVCCINMFTACCCSRYVGVTLRNEHQSGNSIIICLFSSCAVAAGSYLYCQL